MQKVKELIEQRDGIGKQIVAEMQRLFPVGTLLSVPAGRGLAKVKVTGYGASWCDPQRLLVENLNTGRRSTVSGADERVQRLDG